MQDQRFQPGLEIDIDLTGRIIADKDLLEATRFRIGAVHFLSMPKPARTRPAQSRNHAPDRTAHHLRPHPGSGASVPGLFLDGWRKPTSGLQSNRQNAQKHNIAAEINFHHNRPDPVFTRKCLDAGVKISLGSDAHSLYELGAFLPHLHFLREIGYDGDWRDILINAEP